MLSSTTHSGSNFVLTLVVGGLILVVLVPYLWGRIRADARRSAPTYRTRARRGTSGSLANSQGIPCVHCPHVAPTFSELSIHQRFDCPGLRRR